MKKLKSLYQHITCAMCGATFDIDPDHLKPKNDDPEKKTQVKAVCPQCCCGELYYVESSKNGQDA
ncbi:hypothetical protein C4H02_RS22950 [Vibrio parahaemolyticus]|nr:hypothetical protein [Vibrio parahaemolyticus]